MVSGNDIVDKSFRRRISGNRLLLADHTVDEAYKITSLDRQLHPADSADIHLEILGNEAPCNTPRLPEEVSVPVDPDVSILSDVGPRVIVHYDPAGDRSVFPV